jgi:hypothetical protein
LDALDSLKIGTDEIARVAQALKPRYHFAGGEVYYARLSFHYIIT